MRNGKSGKARSKKMMNEVIVAEQSSGNVFADLGLPNAEELLAKAPMVQRIEDLIKERALTLPQAAELLATKPMKLKRLLHGDLDLFTMGQLCRFLKVLGQEVEILIRPSKKRSDRGRTKVIAQG
jgi:predicted XRE-type DNA-binding protein